MALFNVTGLLNSLHYVPFSLLDEEEVMLENQISFDDTGSSNCFICTATDGATTVAHSINPSR